MFDGKYKASEDEINLFEDGVADLITSIALDTELRDSKKARLLDGIKELISNKIPSDVKVYLNQTLKIALEDQKVKANEQIFKNKVAAYASEMEYINMTIERSIQFPGDFNLRMEATQAFSRKITLEKEMPTYLAGIRESVRRSLPLAKKDEGSLITELREQRTESYASIVSTLENSITDKRLLTLDFSLSSAPGTLAQNGSVFSSNVDQNTTLNSGLNSGLQSYNSQNPGQLFAGVDVSILSRMSPDQQIQYRQQTGISGFSNGTNNYAASGNQQYNQYNNNGVPNMYQQGPNPMARPGTRTY